MVIDNENIGTPEENIETPGNEESVVVDAGTEVENQEISNPNEEVGNSPEPTAEEIADWKADKRYGKMWKNENDLYKSFNSLEKWKATHHDPMKQQHDLLMKTFAENQLDPSQLSAYIKEYREFSDPNNPVTARANYLNQWIENPLYKDKIVAMFEDLENQELQRKYPNMGAEERSKMIEMESRLSEYDKKFQAAEQEKLTTQYVSDIQSGLEKCKQLAQKRGFGFPDEVQKALASHCERNKIPPRYIYQVFIDKYGEQLDKSFAEKTEKDVLERLKKNKNAGIVNAGTTKNIMPAKMSLKEKILSKL